MQIRAFFMFFFTFFSHFFSKNHKKHQKIVIFSVFSRFFAFLAGFGGLKNVKKIRNFMKKWKKWALIISYANPSILEGKSEKKWKNAKKTQKNVKKRQKSDKIGHFSAKGPVLGVGLHFLTLFARASIGKSEFPARMTVYLEAPLPDPKTGPKGGQSLIFELFLRFFDVFEQL
jgi:hypothetical protein